MKQDFLPLYRNAAFFSMRGNLKMRQLCITQFHLFLCSWLQTEVRESPQGTKSTTFVLRFFSEYFLLFQTVKTCFFLMHYDKFVWTAHANEWIVCSVSNDWGITETVPSMCTCPISSRLERWHFQLYVKLSTTKLRHRTTILFYVSLPAFIYSSVFIPLKCKLLILATVQFKWPCIEGMNFWHRLNICLTPSDIISACMSCRAETVVVIFPLK